MDSIIKQLNAVKKKIKNKTPEGVKKIIKEHIESMQQELSDAKIKNRLSKAKDSIEKLLEDVKEDDSLSQGTYDSIFQILELAVGIREDDEDDVIEAMEIKVNEIEEDIIDIKRLLNRLKFNRSVK